MAINLPLYKNHRVIIFLALLFCVGIYPVASETAYVNLSGGTQNDFDCTVDGDIITVHYIDIINFNSIEDVGELSYIFFYVNSDDWKGPDSSAEWASVTYKVGAATIGTGQFGYNSGGNTHIVMAYFDEGSWNIGALTGAQEVDIVGSIPSIYIKGPTNPVGLAISGFPSDEVPWFGKNAAGYGAKNIFSRGAGANQTSYFYQSIYEESYSFTYDNTAPLTVNVTRPALSQIDMYNGFVYVLNESSYQDNTPFDVVSPDFVNDTWDITVLNAFSDVDSVTIDFSEVPQIEDTIVWGADSYVVDDTGSYSWSLSNDNWDTVLYSKKASIYRDETLVHEVSLPTQTGTFFYTFEDEGSFTVKLRHTSALLPHKTIDTDTVVVTPIGESFIGVTNATVYINTPIGFQFSYGFTPSTAFQTGIEARKLIDGNWIPVNYWALQSSISGDIAANTLYDYTLAISGHHADTPLSSEGDYMFWLQDANRGDVANTIIYTVEYKPGAPTENISTTYLDITSGESYRMISEIAYNYGIDNTNFTTGTNYFEIYNYDYDQITQSALLSRQTAYEWGTLYPVGVYEPSESYHWGGLVALPGNNSMRIAHHDLNGSTVLVYDNFTLSELNPSGYGLKLSTYEACINEMVTISVTIPSSSNVTIFSPYGVEIITYNMNASGTIIYYFPVSGLYTIKLIPNGSIYEEAVASIFISDCADDGIIEPPSGEMDDMYKNMFNAMTLPAFWGMIIFIGFIGGLAIKRDKNGDALVSGNGLAFIAFGLLNLLSIIGLFAPYTFYIIVSTWIFAGMFFGVGKYLARGEG